MVVEMIRLAFPWIPTWGESLGWDAIDQRTRYRARVEGLTGLPLLNPLGPAGTRSQSPCVVVGG